MDNCVIATVIIIVCVPIYKALTVVGEYLNSTLTEDYPPHNRE